MIWLDHRGTSKERQNHELRSQNRVKRQVKPQISTAGEGEPVQCLPVRRRLGGLGDIHPTQHRMLIMARSPGCTSGAPPGFASRISIIRH
jgi:hypothetical protein